MKKYTKIIATLGPASDSKEIIEKLFKAGMNVARLNFSHGNYDYFSNLIKNIRSVSEEIAILLDTKGPEIRTGKILDGEIELKDNQELILTNQEINGNLEKISINYNQLSKVKIGNKILIDDGLIEADVIEVKKDYIKVKIINGGKLGSNKTVSIWGHNVEIPFLSKKDKKDIIFGIENKIDFIAASFVRSADEILELKKLLKKNNADNIKIISKIEHSLAVKNIDSIIKQSDGIMVARGDLAVEVAAEKVPGIQSSIITKCRDHGIPVIVATQMLESMKDNPRPTRAEVSDVARAIMEGTDAIMLSGETAGGKYPVKSVEMMTKIANEYDDYEKKEILKNLTSEKTDHPVTMFVTKSVYDATKELNIKTILVPTVSGYSARKISRFRPNSPIIAIVHNKQILRQLQLSWGVTSVYVKKYYENRIEMLSLLKRIAIKSKYVQKENDMVIIASGHILNESGHTNNMEIFKLCHM